MLTLSDWAVVCVPIVLAIMGAMVSIKPPGRAEHWYWFAGFLSLGALCAGATLWQVRTSRRGADIDKQTLNRKVDDLQAQVVKLARVPRSLEELRSIITQPKSPGGHAPKADVGLH